MTFKGPLNNIQRTQELKLCAVQLFVQYCTTFLLKTTYSTGASASYNDMNLMDIPNHGECFCCCTNGLNARFQTIAFSPRLMFESPRPVSP